MADCCVKGNGNEVSFIVQERHRPQRSTFNFLERLFVVSMKVDTYRNCLLRSIQAISHKFDLTLFKYHDSVQLNAS